MRVNGVQNVNCEWKYVLGVSAVRGLPEANRKMVGDEGLEPPTPWV